MLTIEYVYALIEKGNKEFLVTDENGEKKKMRLFVAATGQIGYHPPRTRTKGYIFDISRVSNIEPIAKKQTAISPEEKFRKNAEKLVDILTASGLWENILKALKDSNFDYEKYASDNPDFAHSILNWKVKKMDFRDKYLFNTCNADYYKKIGERIKNGENYTIPRKEGRSYDISFDLQKGQDGILRAWYSEEYRNCGNGHYYLAIDSEHAIFYEND